MKIFQIAREYAHLSEAGGVKNVVCSLCEGLVKLNHDVTLFIPLYGCTDLSLLKDYSVIQNYNINILVDEKSFSVSFAKAQIKGLKVIFVLSSCFSEKLGVYTYTAEEEAKNPLHIRGQGHKDSVDMEIVFQKAIIHYICDFNDFPDVIHCHDATTALIPSLANNSSLKNNFSKTHFVVTIHNAGPAYHHEIKNIETAEKLTNLPKEILELGLLGEVVEPYLLASYYAKLTTVSPWYAREITDPNNENTQGLSKAFAERNISIFGITNGIDFEKYNPENKEKSHLPYSYNPEKLELRGKYRAREQFFQQFDKNSLSTKKQLLNFDFSSIHQYGFLDEINDETVLFSYHGRLVHQKGLDVLEQAIPLVLKQNENLRFIITGQGDINLERAQINLTNQFPGKILYLKGYHRALARLCVSITDFIILPSFFEPCGLEDFISSIMGTIPLAHKTGGLQKIIHNRTGFLYSPNTETELAKKIISLVDFKNNHHQEYLRMIKQASIKVHKEYDWSSVIEKYYVPLFLEGK